MRTPCPRCGWQPTYDGYHVCFDKSKKVAGESVSSHTDLSVAEQRQRRADEVEKAKSDRDEKIVQLYLEGMSMKEVGAEVGAHETTVRTALRRHEENTDTRIVRLRGGRPINA